MHLLQSSSLPRPIMVAPGRFTFVLSERLFLRRKRRVFESCFIWLFGKTHFFFPKLLIFRPLKHKEILLQKGHRTPQAPVKAYRCNDLWSLRRPLNFPNNYDSKPKKLFIKTTTIHIKRKKNMVSSFFPFLPIRSFPFSKTPGFLPKKRRTLTSSLTRSGSSEALDTEFPGFLLEDTPFAPRSARYLALRENVEHLWPIQFGGSSLESVGF